MQRIRLALAIETASETLTLRRSPLPLQLAEIDGSCTQEVIKLVASSRDEDDTVVFLATGRHRGRHQASFCYN